MEQVYYAVQRSGEELAHYGVKGMKWGVRKAISSGNAKKLGRQFKKASKKLAKLEKRGASGKKYAKRAAKLGVAGAALGTAGALGSMDNIKKGAQGLRVAGNKAAAASGIKGFKRGKSTVTGTRVANDAADAIAKYGRWASEKVSDKTGNLTRHGAVRLGSMAVGAGLVGAAGYNAYRAATAKRNRKKAAKFRSEMQTAFKGTKYASQIPAAQQQPAQKKRKRNGTRG